MNLDPAPLGHGSIGRARRRGIAKQKLEALIPRHLQPAERVSMGDKLINSISKVKPSI